MLSLNTALFDVSPSSNINKMRRTPTRKVGNLEKTKAENV